MKGRASSLPLVTGACSNDMSKSNTARTRGAGQAAFRPDTLILIGVPNVHAIRLSTGVILASHLRGDSRSSSPGPHRPFSSASMSTTQERSVKILTDPAKPPTRALDSLIEQSIHIVPSFTLECGRTLREVPVAYKTWGKLDETKDNVMVICHAFTGSADVEDWCVCCCQLTSQWGSHQWSVSLGGDL